MAKPRFKGGLILRDLFDEDDGGWLLQDVPLLERLVSEKLQTEAEAILPEGWKWVECAIDFPWNYTCAYLPKKACADRRGAGRI
jgi:hypothetical protein